MEKNRMQKECGMCEGLCSRDEKEVFRLNKTQPEGLPPVSMELAKTLGSMPICAKCKNEIQPTGLKFVSDADIKKWGQEARARKLLANLKAREGETLKSFKDFEKNPDRKAASSEE